MADSSADERAPKRQPAAAKKPRAAVRDRGAAARPGSAAKLQAEEQERLRERCYSSGMVCKAKRLDAEAGGTGLPARADGMDVIKKSSLRKNRYLLNLPLLLEGVSGGKLGDLAQLDTQNPVLYIDYPAGRVRLRGSMLFPTSKFLSLRFGQAQAVCEDVFESMIVFSEACWIGTEAENPEEHPLPMPTTLQRAVPAPVKGSQAAPRTSQPEAGGGTQEGGSQPLRQSQRSVRKRRYRELSDDESSAGDDESSELEAPQAGGSRERSGTPAERPAAAATPASKGKRQRAGARGTLLSFYQPQEPDAAAGSRLEAAAQSPGSDGAAAEAEQPLSQDSGGRRSQPRRAARARPSLPIVLEDTDESGGGSSSGGGGGSNEGSDFSG